MKVEQVIREGYREARQRFSQEADPENVKKTIEAFRDLVQRNQVSGNEKNIDWWAKQGWEKFQTFVNAKSERSSGKERKKSRKTGQSVTIEENNDWLIVVPLDKDASCFYGRNTDWCTTKESQDHYESYFYRRGIVLIYFFNKESGGKWAIAVYPDQSYDMEYQIFNRQDNEISLDRFQSETGLDPKKYINIVKQSDVQERVNYAREEYKEKAIKLERRIENLHNTLRNNPGDFGRDLELENALIKLKGEKYVRDYFELFLDARKYSGMPDKWKFDQDILMLFANSVPGKYFLSPEHTIVTGLTPRVIKQIVRNDPRAIRWIDNPDRNLQLTALQQDPHSYRYIENPDPDIIKKAVGSHPNNIVHLDKNEITTDIMKTAITSVDNFMKEHDLNSSYIMNYIMKIRQETDYVPEANFINWLIDFDEMTAKIFAFVFAEDIKKNNNIKQIYLNKLPDTEKLLESKNKRAKS